LIGVERLKYTDSIEVRRILEEASRLREW
jgi:hypothetical protein